MRRSNSYLGEQNRRLSNRRESKRAGVAVGHSMLVIIYQMLKTEKPYHEKERSALRCCLLNGMYTHSVSNF